MMAFRATVYVLTGMAAAAEGHAGLSRHVVEEQAESTEMFKALVSDRWCSRDVDTDVTFGPVTRKDSRHVPWPVSADARRN
jgi:hypothetical protein